VVALQSDLDAMLVVELTPEVVVRAQALLQRHSLRSGDAVQLASCLRIREQLHDMALVAFDERLIALIRARDVPANP
jgi:predicted nucleic acid-binding protein